MATTSALSSPGIGSGLDVSGIVSKLMSIETAPLSALQTKAQTIQTKLSAVGQLKSLVSTFQDALKPLVLSSNYNQRTAASADAASVAATATATAGTGNYAVNVTAVAASQTLVSAQGQFTVPGDVVGTGTLTLRLGKWSDDLSTFTPKSGSSDVAITIDATHNTLEGIRDQINAAGAGVTASIVSDTSGARLSIRSNDTGADNGFRVTVADDDGANADAAGLSRLAYDPANGAARMTRAQAAVDTAATINGISVTSATQTIAGAVDGLTFTASKVTTSAVTVTVSQNTGAIKNMLGQFVTAYNGLSKFLSSATAYNAETKTGALFQGDSTIVTLQSQLRSMLGQPTSASSTFSTLSSLGVQLQKDGSLKIDDAKLTSALSNSSEVTKALVGDTVTSAPGLMQKFSDWSAGLLLFNGALAGRNDSLKSQLTANQNEQTNLQSRLDQVQKRLMAQYTALDSTMSRATSLSSYVDQQLSALANTAKAIASK